MKGTEVAGIYLLLTSLVTLVLIGMQGPSVSFSLQPLGLSTLLFFVFLPQSIEFLVAGALVSPVPAFVTLVIFVIDLIAGLGLMLA